MSAPNKILELIVHFERNVNEIRADQFNEANVRSQFINSFFECLGWDTDNRQRIAEAYKEVIHEDAIKIGAVTRAPHYCFRVAAISKFFVETKKPAVNIKEDRESAFQLRRYAWSAELPLSILTNFKQFAVYDCRVKPARTDKASMARIRYWTYNEYPDCWSEIVGIFSKAAVEAGSLDQFTESSKGKRGTTVDTAFLEEIESWREPLARNLALRNPHPIERELNFAVQVIIDRIIFLRMCEDRGIEEYGQLLALQNGPAVYSRLKQLFGNADDPYNSGLFTISRDAESSERSAPDKKALRSEDSASRLNELELTIDDEVLKDIIKGLYPSDSPRDFSVLPAEILGQVYEQFLGKVIRLTPDHQVSVEDKPEVRKMGGIYYTPAYIVDHIVKHTVGKLLEDKSPRQAEKLRILDPSCGAGSFLIGAYQYLLDWYRDRYVDDDPGKRAKQLYQTPAGWRLTTAERKRILLNNIYGVDIDPRAVEVTRLTLALKALEEVAEQTVEQPRQPFHERVFPDLATNIKCGNAVIGPDFYAEQHMTMFDEAERLRINAFDWNTEFAAIMQTGGFAAVIGNPPWGQKSIDTDQSVKDYARRHYRSSHGIYDLFRPFVERAIQLLCANGTFGMVLPDIVLLKNYIGTRQHLLEKLALDTIDWWGMTFRGAVIDAATITGTKQPAPADHRVRVEVHDAESPLRHEMAQADFWANPQVTFNLYLTPEKRRVLQHLKNCPTLADYFEVHEGVHSGNMRQELFVTRCVDTSCRELYFGRDEISPFFLKWNGAYVRLNALPARKTRQKYANLGNPEWHCREKLLVRRTGDFVLAAVDRRGYFASNNFFLVMPRRSCSLDLDGLGALLNSAFMTWFFRTIEPRRGRVFAELKIKHIGIFPMPLAILEKEGCLELNHLGKARAELALRRAEGARAQEIASLQRTEKAIEGKTESLVQKLLGLQDFPACGTIGRE